MTAPIRMIEFRRLAACCATKVVLWNIGELPGGGGPAGQAGGRDQVRLRSTFGTFAASGSASKNSRFVKPSGPARSTFGKTWIALL